ncbi:Cupin domain-containing protein [Pseudoduganella lurida]|uniref:Cupin domain-containing protein n=1 Tax=Pseudoduganella lurida TaxID=1036180 RepID=A0A562R0E2_9BURK|nr:cupin domain-containing protein [Pseudoduganella lurida]TWI61910.1 Cupin domain-containing protein [Pseudoduganella lurida]
MLASILLLAVSIAQAEVPPVPGLCTAPVPTDRESPGCYQTGRLEMASPPGELYWHIHQFPTLEAATVEAGRHRWATVAQAHSRIWLYVLDEKSARIDGGAPRAVIGPLHPPAGPVTAHFAESIFPPGMRTRVHSHPGPEAFYVIEGEQCMETPDDRQRVGAGSTYLVDRGPHLQAAPRGRRNLVLILAPHGQAAVVPGGDWQPSGFCDR